ncbi:MAG: DUF5683 domain-containing protein [Cytophagales bacterium]|nr:DUF5683 domain-containing protein [Cytophagales bacterium]
MKKGFLLILLSFCWTLLLAQENENARQDSIIYTEDNVLITEEGIQEIVTETPRNLPNKVALYSAILPGLGQIYNKKAWKLPIIYGGGMTLVFSSINYNTQYLFFREALFLEVDGDPNTINGTGLNESQIRRRVDFFRRNRDFFIILTGALYLLNILDAHVDAHLREFDVNDQLAFSIKPAMVQNPWNIANVGLSLQLKVKP